MQGIVLAGGKGSRLYPMTSVISKQLLPVYDKPMIYYSISTLMLSGIRDITIISDPINILTFQDLLKNGEQWGLTLSYIVQDSPDGLPQAFTLTEHHIKDDRVALILGDNIFHGAGLGTSLQDIDHASGCIIFGYPVENASEYGVVTLENGTPVKLEEKPSNPTSKLAIPGLYFCDREVFEISRTLERSVRGEFEIVDVLQKYLDLGQLHVRVLPRGAVWLDSGTPNSLSDASNYVRVLENRQGLKISCPEEIAIRQGFISFDQYVNLYSNMPTSDYKSYLESISATVI